VVTLVYADNKICVVNQYKVNMVSNTFRLCQGHSLNAQANQSHVK